MADRIHVVVTCTQSKRKEPAEGLRFRVLSNETDVSKRCYAWTRRLTEHPSATVPARDLYKGGHWSVALDMERAGIEVWVASAGYGLLSLEDAIKPYAATFTAGHADSVCRGRAQAQAWWEQLGRRAVSRSSGKPRTLRDLIADDPSSRLLVAASPPYLQAMESDLVAAINELQDPDRVVVVSVGSRAASGRLADFQLEVDARVQTQLGGAMQSLNVRVARDILEHSKARALSRAAVRERYRELQDGLAEFKYPERRKLADEAVVEFIQRELRSDPSSTQSRLLRMLRDSGHACEQSRFSKIFRQTKANAHA